MVEVGDDQSVVVLLVENISEFGGNTDSTLGIYGILVSAPEQDFPSSILKNYTTFSHFFPLSLKKYN
jgi:hypothetical protein